MSRYGFFICLCNWFFFLIMLWIFWICSFIIWEILSHNLFNVSSVLFSLFPPSKNPVIPVLDSCSYLSYDLSSQIPPKLIFISIFLFIRLSALFLPLYSKWYIKCRSVVLVFTNCWMAMSYSLQEGCEFMCTYNIVHGQNKYYVSNIWGYIFKCMLALLQLICLKLT